MYVLFPLYMNPILTLWLVVLVDFKMPPKIFHYVSESLYRCGIICPNKVVYLVNSLITGSGSNSLGYQAHRIYIILKIFLCTLWECITIIYICTQWHLSVIKLEKLSY